MVSLASGFPLKWPDEVEAMFNYMGMLAQASSYAFNPACSDSEGGYFPRMPDGKPIPAFYQKAIAMQIMPFIAVFFSCLFWTVIFIWDICDPPHKRKKRKIRKKKARAKRKKTQEVEKFRLKLETLDLKKKKKRNSEALVMSSKLQKSTQIVPATRKSPPPPPPTQRANEEAKKQSKEQSKEQGEPVKLTQSNDSKNSLVKVYQSTSGKPDIPKKPPRTALPKKVPVKSPKPSKAVAGTTTTKPPTKPPPKPPPKKPVRKNMKPLPKPTETKTSVASPVPKKAPVKSSEPRKPSADTTMVTKAPPAMAPRKSKKPIAAAKPVASTTVVPKALPKKAPRKSKKPVAVAKPIAAAKPAAPARPVAAAKPVASTTVVPKPLPKKPKKALAKSKQPTQAAADEIVPTKSTTPLKRINTPYIKQTPKKKIMDPKSESKPKLFDAPRTENEQVKLGKVSGEAKIDQELKEDQEVKEDKLDNKQSKKELKIEQAHLKAQEELSQMLYQHTIEEPEDITLENVHKHRAAMFQGNDMVTPEKKARRQSMGAKIKQNMAVEAKLNKSGILKFDKFCATIVTVMYLCYPVLIKSTFQLVACMPVGKNTYLQRDLNIRCWETDENGDFTGIHFTFVLYLFIPGIILWVIGMPRKF